MATIKYEITGEQNFLKTAEYLFYIPNFLKEFEDKFRLAENVTIRFEENINPDPNKPVPPKLTVSDDGKHIKVIYKSSRFIQPKGGMSKPGESEFFRGLEYYMENTVIAEDNKRYEQLDNNQEP